MIGVLALKYSQLCNTSSPYSATDHFHCRLYRVQQLRQFPRCIRTFFLFRQKKSRQCHTVRIQRLLFFTHFDLLRYESSWKNESGRQLKRLIDCNTVINYKRTGL